MTRSRRKKLAPIFSESTFYLNMFCWEQSFFFTEITEISFVRPKLEVWTENFWWFFWQIFDIGIVEMRFENEYSRWHCNYLVCTSRWCPIWISKLFKKKSVLEELASLTIHTIWSAEDTFSTLNANSSITFRKLLRFYHFYMH